MKHTHTAVGWPIALMLAVWPTFAAEAGPVPLGHDPLCEASAAIVAPWDPSLVVVADNEDEKAVFTFRVQDGSLVGQAEAKVPKLDRPKDVESVAVDRGRLVLVGSQSRDSRCGVKTQRQRIAFYRWDAERKRLALDQAIDGAPPIAAAAQDVAACQHTLFTSPTPALAAEFCSAFVAAEAAARTAKGSCVTINIEGAVAIPSSEGGASRIWLGLRSPLVAGNAVLLRLDTFSSELRFDAVAMLDLGKRGVRELALHDGALWGIAGKPLDAREGFALWRLPLADVKPGAKALVASFTRDLPTSAEGLVFAGAEGIVVFDVDRPKGGGACQSRQLPLGDGTK